MAEKQETDEQGFILALDGQGRLTVIDSIGGGRDLGYLIDENEATRLVADYIRELSQWMAEELVGQIEWPDAFDEYGDEGEATDRGNSDTNEGDQK